MRLESGTPIGSIGSHNSNPEPNAAERRAMREAIVLSGTQLATLIDACRHFAQVHGALPVPGYTHLRRGMPSSLAGVCCHG